MDIFKVLMMYMALTVTGSAQQAPDLTPPPVTPAPIVEVVQLTPTPAPETEEAAKTYATLRPGNEGTAVRALQEKLTELGFLSGKIDGQYGPKTKSAVAAYQKHCGLKEDGIAGNETLSRLYSQDPMATATPAPSVIPAVMVPVYYMDQDTGSQLFAMDITCYGSTTIYANSNHVPGGYHLVSDSSVKITLENNVASPSSISFYYSMQAPEATLAPSASPVPSPAPETEAEAEEIIPLTLQDDSLLLNGESVPLSWYTDEEDQVWLPLKDVALLMGWDMKENESCTLMGKEVLLTYDEKGLYSIAVDGTLCTEMGLHQQGTTYVSLSFLQLLGCPAERTENTIDISLSV